MSDRNINKEVLEMGIKQEDLPYLPFTLVKWECIIHGCCNGPVLKDYGIAPYYLWRNREWIEASYNFYFCSRHWPLIKKGKMYRPDDEDTTPEKNLKQIKPPSKR